MLTTSLLWVVLLGAAWGYGWLCREVNDGDTRAPELFVSEIYLGILIIGGILLTISLQLRLAWWIGLLIVLPGLAICFRKRPRIGKVGLWGGLLLLMLIALFTCSREITYYDTGLYHQQAVKWLSGYGLVRGLALVHFRFGFASSWFALAAPFNDAFAGRTAAVIGGVPFVLITFLIAGTLRRWLRGQQSNIRSLSWLSFCASLLVVAVTWNLESSLSPDLTIWLLPIVVATTLTDPDTSSGVRLSTSCLLAALGCLMKLTALPIVLYLIFIVVPSVIRTMGWRSRIQALAFLLATGVVGVAAYLRLSGCPAFPMVAFCEESDWTVGPRVAESVGALMTKYALGHGLLRSETLPLIALAGVFSLVAWRDGRSVPFVRHGLGMSWTGIVFVLWLAPNARYAMGYIMLPVSIGIAAWLTKARPESVAVHLTQSGRFRFVAYGLGAIAVALVLLGATGDDFLVPRRMARTDGDPIRIVNRQARTSATFSVSQDAGVPFRVLRPFASDQCWDAELPCTPRLTVTGIRLRDESRGYSQGFVRSLGSRDGEIAMVRPVPGTSASPEGR